MTDQGSGRTAKRILFIVVAILVAIIGAVALTILRPERKSPPSSKASPSPSQPSPSPSPVNPQVGEDVEAAFRVIYSIRTRAVSERRPELVDEIYRPACGCRNLRSIIEKATAARQLHHGYDPKVTLVIRLTEGFVQAPNLADLRVITEQGPYQIVTEDGTVIDEDPGWRPQVTYWRLVRTGPGAPWMVDDLEVEGTVEEVDELLGGPGWRETPR
jgi:hypothetical protein